MSILLKVKGILLGATLALSTQAYAAVITNGGFETGFAGWTRADQLGSDGTFFLQTGTASPINGDAVPAPPGPLTAAMTDAQGPGSHVLYQNFTVTSPVSSALLMFDLFIGNRAGTFISPSSLDFSTPALNQQARVDILGGATDPFSVLAADVLLNAFQTNPGDAAISGYTHHVVDITGLLNSHLNTSLRLRFAEVDNLFTFQLGVDNVDIQVGTPVPEPSTFVAIFTGLIMVGVARGRIR